MTDAHLGAVRTAIERAIDPEHVQLLTDVERFIESHITPANIPPGIYTLEEFKAAAEKKP